MQTISYFISAIYQPNQITITGKKHMGSEYKGVIVDIDFAY